MSLNLPKSTEINRFVAKTNFYKHGGITSRLRDIFEQQIERITWVNKIAPTTMNIYSGDISEFQLFDIQLKSYDLDSAALLFIQKTVPYPIIFTLRGARGIKAVAVIGGVAKPTMLSTDWRADLSLEVKGGSTDLIYKNYLLQLSPSFAAVNGDTEKHLAVTRLKRHIDALALKIKNEKQINKRQSFARERHEVEIELEELLG